MFDEPSSPGWRDATESAKLHRRPRRPTLLGQLAVLGKHPCRPRSVGRLPLRATSSRLGERDGDGASRASDSDFVSAVAIAGRYRRCRRPASGVRLRATGERLGYRRGDCEADGVVEPVSSSLGKSLSPGDTSSATTSHPAERSATASSSPSTSPSAGWAEHGNARSAARGGDGAVRGRDRRRHGRHRRAGVPRHQPRAASRVWSASSSAYPRTSRPTAPA